MTLTLRRAGPTDLDIVAPLFDGYRQFYRHPSDLERARAFMSERLAKGDSIVFLAEDEGRAVGFTQLYPSFSSTSTGPILILNDLYVEPDHRRAGAGRLLLEAAVAYGRQTGCVRLTLTTEWNNSVAQAAYERGGWKPSSDFKTYNFTL